MRPRLGFTRPVSTLKNVVLPAPFGPMMPCSSPSGTDRSTCFEHDAVAEAHMHALGFDQRHHPLRNSSAQRARRRALRMRAALEHGLDHAGDALRPEQHQRHEQQAEPQHPGVGERADDVARDQEDDDADHRPPEADQPAADQRHHHDQARNGAGSSRPGRRRAAPWRTGRRPAPRQRRREREHASACRARPDSRGARRASRSGGWPRARGRRANAPAATAPPPRCANSSSTK